MLLDAPSWPRKINLAFAALILMQVDKLSLGRWDLLLVPMRNVLPLPIASRKLWTEAHARNWEKRCAQASDDQDNCERFFPVFFLDLWMDGLRLGLGSKLQLVVSQLEARQKFAYRRRKIAIWRFELLFVNYQIIVVLFLVSFSFWCLLRDRFFRDDLFRKDHCGC